MIQFVLGVIVGTVIVWLLMRGRQTNSQNPNAEAIKQKQENLNQILNLLTQKTEVSNNDVETLLKVSDATAERYLQELEKAGKIRQVGSDGRGVIYQLV